MSLGLWRFFVIGNVHMAWITECFLKILELRNIHQSEWYVHNE